MLWNAIQMTKLVERQPQGHENFEVELRQGLGRKRGDLFVEPRFPAQHAHHEFGGEAVIARRKIFMRGRVQ